MLLNKHSTTELDKTGTSIEEESKDLNSSVRKRENNLSISRLVSNREGDELSENVKHNIKYLDNLKVSAVVY